MSKVFRHVQMLTGNSLRLPKTITLLLWSTNQSNINTWKWKTFASHLHHLSSILFSLPPTRFQNKFHELPLGIMNSGHNATSPNVWTQLGWGQLFKGLTWRRVWHVQDQGTVFAPPTFRKGSTSKLLTTALRNNPNSRQKSWLGKGLRNEKDIGCSALPSQLN